MKSNEYIDNKIKYIDSLLEDDNLLNDYIDKMETNSLSSPDGLKESIYKRFEECDMKEALTEMNDVKKPKRFRKLFKVLKVSYVAILAVIISESVFSYIYSNEEDINKKLDDIIETSKEQLEYTHSLMIKNEVIANKDVSNQ